MCNLHWCYTFCIGVTLELHCSHPIRSNRVIFSCVLFCHLYRESSTVVLLNYFVASSVNKRGEKSKEKKNVKQMKMNGWTWSSYLWQIASKHCQSFHKKNWRQFGQMQWINYMKKKTPKLAVDKDKWISNILSIASLPFPFLIGYLKQSIKFHWLKSW